VHCFPRTAPLSRWSSSPTVASGSIVLAGRGWAALGAPARSWRSLDEEVRTASFSLFFILADQVSLERRAKSGERFQTAHEDLARGWTAL
jgi:hypothetical protein